MVDRMMKINSTEPTFLSFAELAQTIAVTRGNHLKIKLCAQYFSKLDSDNLRRAAQFFGEGAFSTVSGKRASIGHRTIAVLAAEFCEIDYDLVFRPSRTATGSSSETIQRLFENIPEAQAKWISNNLTLAQIEEIFEKLYNTKNRTSKKSILDTAWRSMTPLEVKYFIRIMGQGSLRIGFETKSVISSLALAFVRDIEKVRYAHMISGSLGEAAILAREDKLDNAEFTLFNPLSFMLASPIENRKVDNLDEYIAEEKFDGIRCQIHKSDNNIELYTRDLNVVSSSFPEILRFFVNKDLPDIVLDGEICVFKNDTILPFQLLQKRIGVKKPSEELINNNPVVFIAYDLLYLDKECLFHETLTDRRSKLENIARIHNLLITSQIEISSEKDIEEAFNNALAHGNEGLMLKHKESTYEYGQRRKSWLKVKKPSGSLDTVILYAHAGSGKRGGTYSDFTLGISVKDDERYEEDFIPIGKAYGGYTNDELKNLNKRIKELVIDRFGSTLQLKPSLMVELEFEDIQINRRTKAKYTLRFPRFKAIRWDLSPSDADSLKDVEEMYNHKINKQRESQRVNPSFITY